MDLTKVKSINALRLLQRRSKFMYTSSSNNFNATVPHSFLTSSLKPINPNKAVFTIDSKTGQILIVNNNACQLLGYTSCELQRKEFFELLSSKKKHHVFALSEMVDGDDGMMVILSGKVVEITTKQNKKIAVSLWIRKIDSEGRCLAVAVAEPVERHVCVLHIDYNGIITYADQESSVIFQYDSLDKLLGIDIKCLIPAIKIPDFNSTTIPKGIRKQKATGKTTDNVIFPLCLLINKHESSRESLMENDSARNGFELTIWVFQNISGLVVIDEFGYIKSCNQHFSLLMFGYSQEKILGMHIKELLPNFGIAKNATETRSRNITNSSLISDWEGDIDPLGNESKVSLTATESLNFLNDDSRTISKVNDLDDKMNCKADCRADLSLHISEYSNRIDNGEETSSIAVHQQEIDSLQEEAATPVNPSTDFLTATCSGNLNLSKTNLGKSFSSTSMTSSLSSLQLNCEDGNFKSEAIHSDGNKIDVMYSVSTQLLPCMNRFHCIWIWRCNNKENETETDNDKHANLTLTFNSVTSTVDYSLGQIIKTTAAQNSSRPSSVSIVSHCEDDQISGDFYKYYTNIKDIGKGAYGYVKLSYRNSDRLLVVTKFILKEKLCSHFLVKDDKKKEIPIEIYLLRSLQHPNIVSMLDVFENDQFFQLVMERHGSGMDLFEFIERRPLITEELGSYIFRQIVGAVSYLHNLKILHRDIKDENIIIDQHFHIKLIDFGSATFMEEGKYFSTFFGTTEYCSPEVLAGNKYSGPELEVWSLGVTLYVLMFFENPFIDVEETLKAELIIPQTVSVNLENLLCSMLMKDPVKRCTLNQLLRDVWLNQEVNPSAFNFSWIVPCEPTELNPDKYFNDQIYCSTTALSNISPQGSLSLIDEDYLLPENNSKAGDDDSSCKLCGNVNIVYEAGVGDHYMDNKRESFNKNFVQLTRFENKILNKPVRGCHGKPQSVTESCLCMTNLTSPCIKMQHVDDLIKSNQTEKQGISLGLSKKLSKMNVSDFSLDYDFTSCSCIGRNNFKAKLTSANTNKLLNGSIHKTCHFSKSENNLYDKKDELSLSIYNVVSMDNVLSKNTYSIHNQLQLKLENQI